MYLVKEVKLLFTKTLFLGGILAICSIEDVIERKTLLAVNKVLVFAILLGADVFLVSLSTLLLT